MRTCLAILVFGALVAGAMVGSAPALGQSGQGAERVPDGAVSTAASSQGPAAEAEKPPVVAEPKPGEPESTGRKSKEELDHELAELAIREQMDLAKSAVSPWVQILVPIGVCGIVPVAAVVIVVLLVHHGRQKMLHGTIRLMVERGQPIPPELLIPREAPRRRGRLLTAGLVFLAIGLGFSGVLLAQGERNWPLGVIPMLIGVALLASYVLENRRTERP